MIVPTDCAGVYEILDGPKLCGAWLTGRKDAQSFFPAPPAIHLMMSIAGRIHRTPENMK